MSQTPHGKNDWLKEHYEQLALLVMLFLLFGSCVYLVMTMGEARSSTELSLQRINWQGDELQLKGTQGFEDQLAKAREDATAAVTMPERMTMSRERVSCIHCARPIEYDATQCPFCGMPQPEVYNEATSDTDGDGIPDQLEQQLGMDPKDPADAEGDLDGDGFTNLEEYVSGTDPKDPESYPDPVVKLRVAAMRPVPFYLRFVSVQDIGEGNQRFQLNMQSQERTYFSKIGDVVMGYRVDAYDKAEKGETLTLTRVADQRKVVLVKGKPVTEQEIAILFCSMLDRQAIKPAKRLNDEVPYKGKTYKVIDIQRGSVVIQEVNTAQKIAVPLLSDGEKQALQSADRPKSSAAAPAAAQAETFGGW